MVEIIETKEKDDGSLDITFEFTREELDVLLNFAINRIIREKLETSREEVKDVK